MACAVSESTRVDVAKFSSAPNALWPYFVASVHAEDHPHPIAGRALPLTPWRRIALRKCEEPFLGDMNPVSSGSTLRSLFSGYSLVRLSETACDALISRGITDRKQQSRSECCPENRAICSDGWKRSNTHTRHAPQTTGSQEGGNRRVFARPKVLQEVHQLYAQQQRPKEESEHPTTKGS